VGVGTVFCGRGVVIEERRSVSVNFFNSLLSSWMLPKGFNTPPDEYFSAKNETDPPLLCNSLTDVTRIQEAASGNTIWGE